MANNIEKNSGSRDFIIDEIRGIGIILMVIGHANAPMILTKIIYGFHMPLFFLISGYLYDRNKYIKKGFIYLCKKKAKAYLIPYIKLFVVNLILWLFLQIASNNLVDLNFFNYVFLGFFYSYDVYLPNCGPIWFLTSIFSSFLLFYPLMKLTGIKRLVLGILYFVIYCLLKKGMCLLTISQLPWHFDIAFLTSLFMLLGYYIKCVMGVVLKNIKRIYIYILSFLSFFCSVFLILINDRVNIVNNEVGKLALFFPGAFLACLSIFFVFFVRKNTKKCSRLLQIIGINSLYFLGFNYFINVIVHRMWVLLNLNINIIYTVVDTFFVIIGCLLLSYAKKHLEKKVICKFISRS